MTGQNIAIVVLIIVSVCFVWDLVKVWKLKKTHLPDLPEVLPDGHFTEIKTIKKPRNKKRRPVMKKRQRFFSTLTDRKIEMEINGFRDRLGI